MKKEDRPLSPHLQVYRPQMTSVLSILHRFTGVLLVLGFLGIIVWLYSLTQNCYACFTQIFMHFSFVGCFVLFAFFYHFFNGVRHILWDTGRGLKIACIEKTGIAILVLTFVATFLTLYWW